MFKFTQGTLLVFFLLFFMFSCGSDDKNDEICKEKEVKTQKCGENNLGKQTRTCTNNSWTEWTECIIPATCEENKTEEQVCGENNTGKQTRT